ncbi:DUF6161 domain-containing protein [Methylobacterium sp. CM6247]
MAENATPLVSFHNKSTDKSVNLYSVEQIKDFIKTQLDGYEWVGKLNNTHMVNELRQNVFQALYQANNALGSLETDPQAAPMINNYLTAAFSNVGLPTVGTADFLFVDEVRTQHSDHSAIISLAYILNRLDQLNLNHRTTWIGLTLAIMRDEGIGATSAKSSKKNYDGLSVRLTNHISLSKNEEASRIQDYNELCERLKKRADILRRWQWRVAQRSVERSRLESQIAIADLASVQKTYEEMMKLKAPVDYWRDKAKEHRKEAVNYRSSLLWHARWVAPSVLASLLLVAGLSFLFAQADKPFSAYLILVTIGVVITTMAFWAARIMVRLYMSEHHLAIDADERATMAMTYLALIERGAADEKERALILAPLFRPSSDGIVKDDAAPDLSPAALLSKMLNK